MPVTLHHGPASKEKQSLFLEQITRELGDRSQHFLVLTPHQKSTQDLQSLLLQQSKRPALLGEQIIPFKLYLQQLLKESPQKTRLISQRHVVFLMHLAACQVAESWLNAQGNPASALQNLSELAKRCKECGLLPKDLPQIFIKNLNSPIIFEILKRYQEILTECHRQDEGDLLLNSLSFLANNKSKQLSALSSLHLYNFYPLKAGHRQFIRVLKEQYPKLNIHIWYDEDFGQNHPDLSYVYEDLGMICDHSKHIKGKIPQESLLVFDDPINEADFIASQISAFIKQGLRPGNIQVVSLAEEHSLLIHQTLKNKNILSQVQSSLPVKEHIKNPDNPASLAFLIKDNLQVATWHHLAKQALEQFNKEIDFIKSDLQNLGINDFPNELATLIGKSLRFQTAPANQGVNIVSLQQAQTNGKLTFVSQLALENIIKTKNSDFVSPLTPLDPALSEIIEPAHRQMQVALQMLQSAFVKSEQLILTRSETDLSGKALSSPPLTQITDSQKQPWKIKKQTKHKKESSYTKPKKNSFSITELQEYLTCPHRYHARYVLGLQKPEEINLEPEARTKGTVIHQILQRLIQENETIYLEGLEYASYRNKVFAKLEELAAKLINEDEQWAKCSSALRDFFIQKTADAIKALINKEAHYFSERKKRTTPKLCEWDFGKEQNLIFEFNDQSIHLKGRIDRIDFCQSAKQFTVIDYKTGNLPGGADIKKAEALQMPLYLMAVQKKFPAFTPSAALYYSLKDNSTKGVVIKSSCDNKVLSHHSYQISAENWLELTEKIKARVQELVTGIHEGVFAPKPLKESDCQFCEFRMTCGRFQEDTA
ncbi:MAG: PD-(D/E)XK nuclease family protein [Deltaproteobacteria bacterium]|nr:PD-(D/E)XK nuclease family protein [Deltaproteobacteria bacterium]